MFRIHNGRFISKYISFIPPEIYSLDLRRNEYIDRECAKFVSVDGSVEVEVGFEKQMPDEETSLEEYASDCELYRLSEFSKFKRGRGDTVGAYYGKLEYTAIIYREVHNFRMNDFWENQVSVTITASKWRLRDVNPIYKVMEIPQIKCFLDSIEYFTIPQE